MIAAFLYAQLEEAEQITEARLSIWQRYHELLKPLEQSGLLRRPIIPDGCRHNGHMYYVLVAEGRRQQVLDALKDHEIWAVFHYVPLHSSPAGIRYGRAHGSLDVTNSLAERLIRLPLWVGFTAAQQERVAEVLAAIA